MKLKALNATGWRAFVLDWIKRFHMWIRFFTLTFPAGSL